MISFDQKVEKYTAIHARLQKRKKPINDGHLEEFSNFVDFCAEEEASDLDGILGEGVDEAVRTSVTARHIELDGEASSEAEASV